MAEHIIENILLHSQKTDNAQPAKMAVITFSSQEQKVRALKSLLLFWLIAALAVLIPVAHFILVPAFLITGIIAAKRRWHCAKEGIKAEGLCPECEQAITITLEKNADFPQWHHCPECDGSLELQTTIKT